MMKKIRKKQIKKVMVGITIALSAFAMILLTYALVEEFTSGKYTLERTIKKGLADDEELCSAVVINESKGVGDCTFNE
jgi:hypothetical protein